MLLVIAYPAILLLIGTKLPLNARTVPSTRITIPRGINASVVQRDISLMSLPSIAIVLKIRIRSIRLV